MTSVTEAASGWMISGFQTQVFLWCWTALVLSYGLYRSFASPEPDSIRPSGPTE
jgi:hypothetical protein